MAIDTTADSSLETLARTLHAWGAATWRDLPLEFEDFLTFFRERRGGDADALDAAGLFLACACLRGQPRALRRFEEHYGALLSVAVPRGLRERLPDDFQSAVRERLLVGSPTRPPTLAKYSGRGALGGWLRVMVYRHAISIARRGRRPLALGHNPFDATEWGASPESLYLREESREQLHRAFLTASGALSQRERRLVADSWLNGCSTRALAIAYEVHHATVARWVHQANTKLFEHMRRDAREAMRIDDGSGDFLDLLGDVPLELSA